ncbi:MAG TPA: acetate/propionate family kinase [Planctomycetota bacterium]
MAAILALNAGSSSLKYALFDPERVASGKIEGAGSLDAVLAAIGRAPAAVGHRIVHGGPRYLAPSRVTPELLAELRRISPFDPEHLPAEIALIEAVERRFPGLPQVACFDTAFHKDLPRASRILPIPRKYEAQGVRRYGFHGLSYAYLVDVLRREPAGLPRRLVIAHLGNGASLAAILDGRSVDTTMAFTPTSGVPMSRRSGDLDPGLVAYLGLTPEAWHEMVNTRSGLLGISETSGDVRDLLAREKEDVRAAEALAVFVHRVKQAVGAFAATLGGLDALVFTGGIGENSAEIRRRVCEGLDFLNAAVRVVKTDEESRIASETREIVG